MNRSILWAALILLLPIAAGADGRHYTRIAGVVFEKQMSAESVALRLNGAGLLRYLGFKGYAAALYVEEGSSADRVLDDVPRRLEIEYFRSISADRFRQATNDGIERNVGVGLARQLAPEIERFNRFYSDVEPGDRYALTYLPERGTELSLNGVPLGVVEGTEFARALFSIWLGPRPFDITLKTDLLGKES